MAEGDGYGQQRPETANSEYNAFTFAIDQALSKLHTVKIVKVQAVDVAAKTVQVLPLVKQIDGNNQVTSQGTIYSVPYRALLFGKNAVEADPAVDDVGVMICADRDISAVKESHDEAPPGSLRQYDQADGIYIGGLWNPVALEQYIRFTDDGMTITAKGGHTLSSTSAGGWSVDKLTVTGNLQLGGSIVDDGGGTYTGDIHTSGTITGDTDVVSGLIHLKTHKHTGVTTGGGTSGGPTP
jgi:hypothetical protein